MYSFNTESFEATYRELEPLYREQYAEMCARLAKEGHPVSPFNPRLDEYFKASRAGYLHTFTARCDGAPVGYVTVYITNDMHNGDRIAREDALFITKTHRNGVGRRLALYGLDAIRNLGAKRMNVSAATDPRAAKLWERLGFKPIAVEMVYQF